MKDEIKSLNRSNAIFSESTKGKKNLRKSAIFKAILTTIFQTEMDKGSHQPIFNFRILWE